MQTWHIDGRWSAGADGAPPADIPLIGSQSVPCSKERLKAPICPTGKKASCWSAKTKNPNLPRFFVSEPFLFPQPPSRPLLPESEWGECTRHALPREATTPFAEQLDRAPKENQTPQSPSPPSWKKKWEKDLNNAQKKEKKKNKQTNKLSFIVLGSPEISIGSLSIPHCGQRNSQLCAQTNCYLWPFPSILFDRGQPYLERLAEKCPFFCSRPGYGLLNWRCDGLSKACTFPQGRNPGCHISHLLSWAYVLPSLFVGQNFCRHGERLPLLLHAPLWPKPSDWRLVEDLLTGKQHTRRSLTLWL